MKRIIEACGRLAVAVVLMAGAAASAGDSLHGCYNEHTGALRALVEGGGCKDSEIAIPGRCRVRRAAWARRKGDMGAQGLRGDTGAQGLKGDTGAQGLKGDKGVQGPQGEVGARGQTGPQGPQGVIGTIDELEGIPCTHPRSGDSGNILVRYADHDAYSTSVSFNCVPAGLHWATSGAPGFTSTQPLVPVLSHMPIKSTGYAQFRVENIQVTNWPTNPSDPGFALKTTDCTTLNYLQHCEVTISFNGSTLGSYGASVSAEAVLTDGTRITLNLLPVQEQVVP